VEELTDDQQFDLAWVPVMFLAPEVAARGLERTRTNLCKCSIPLAPVFA
jgi:hypothetical protein